MPTHEFSRRRFLLISAALMAAGPSSCAKQSTDPFDDFMHLSSLLTGFAIADLDARVGRAYFDAISANLPAGTSMQQIYTRAKLNDPARPQSYDELEATGVFDDAAAAAVLDDITNYWYSGTVPARNPLGLRVVTYDGALAWRAITWTTPTMTCRGVTGFWSDAPKGGVA